jgi:hypothetical protein
VEAVDIARRLGMAIAQNDVETVRAGVHPDVIWEPPSRFFGPHRRQARFSGRDEVVTWMERLPERDYVVEQAGFEAVGRGVLSPTDLRFDGGEQRRVFMAFVFAGELLRDGRMFAFERTARAWLEDTA